METQSLSVRIQLIIAARERADALIYALQNSPRQPLDIARDRAAGAVQQFCAELMDELVASVSFNSTSDAAKVKECYTELALDFAKSVRDLEADAERRHAIAQAIQYKILESERRLRAVLRPSVH